MINELAELYRLSPFLIPIAILLSVVIYLYKENKEYKQINIGTLTNQVNRIIAKTEEIQDEFHGIKTDIIELRGELKDEVITLIQEVQTIKNKMSEFDTNYHESVMKDITKIEKMLASNKVDLKKFKVIMVDFNKRLKKYS